MFITDHLLSGIVFLPVVGAGLIVFLRNLQTVRRVTLGVTLAELALSLLLWRDFDRVIPEMQFVERVAWMPTFNIHYALGVDGISLPLVLMTAVLFPLCVLCSWRSIERNLKGFLILFLTMETATMGVFCVLDLVLFFMFWEAMLAPMYFLIGLWGGPQRAYAAIKFVLYSLAGSLMLLIGILGLYLAGGHSFDLVALSRVSFAPALQTWLFLAFFIAFAIKVPMFPFHTWLPDAHSEAPTAGSVILASMLLKMGAYGFIRFTLPMLPDATMAFLPLMIGLSLFAILYGGYMALAQDDLKRLIAYSSVSHMGYVTLGLFVLNVEGIEGAILQMVNHGITTGALFLAVGQLYDRTHSRLIQDYGGLFRPMPRYVTMLAIFSFASFGLPGTNNFISEFLVLIGTSLRSLLITLVALGGILLAAGYMLWTIQRLALGEMKQEEHARLPDLNWREMATIVPLVVLVFVIGLYPASLLNLMHASVTHLVARLDAAQTVTAAMFLP